MTQHVRRAYRRHRRGTAGIVVLLALAAGLVFAVLPAGAADGGAPSGLGVTPTVVALGGQTGDCAAVGSTAQYELRIVNPQNASYTDPVTGATFTLTVSAGQTLLGFTASGGAAADIVIKGGTKSTHYDYFAAGIGSVASDTALHAPPKGNTYYGVSHISLCYSTGVAISLGCGDTATGTSYVVQVGVGQNCTKSADSQFVFETWSDGNTQYAKLVPAGSAGSGTAYVVEKITWSFTASSQNATTLRYDDDLSNGLSFVPMPFCNYDPRAGELTLVVPTDAAAVLPSGATSCLIASTESVDDTLGAPDTRVDYVFSSVDGIRTTP